MLLRLIKGVVVLLLLATAVIAGGLAWLHWEIQRERSPLPIAQDMLAFGESGELPVKLSVIETARQRTPRETVVTVDGGSQPEPYVMTHPSFVLEWADGRLLLVDVGMTHAGAIKFGGPIEQFFEGGPPEALTTVAVALGDATPRVQGIVFTHLHIDHVDGLRELCPRVGHPVKVFMAAAQMDSWTPFTAEGKNLVEHAGCTERVRIGGAPLMPLDGFPGVAVMAVGGHTPGSQVVLAAMRDAAGSVRRYLFSGDVTNTIEGMRRDVPKPLFYRLVVVPEDDDRLGELRRYFGALERDRQVAIVVSHDQGHLHTLGIPAWGS